MNELENQTTDNGQPATDYLWILNCSLITAVAVFLRFYWLELKPLHHDEGVNGYFLTNLFREGVYKYDPANYHGPDLYYLALAFSKVFGLETISIRASVAIFGVFTVFLAFFLKKYIGKIGSLAAALFLAVSPGMVYISRYFIHEILFVFFSFGIVISILYFIERQKAGVFAIASMSLLLLVCFSPSVFNLANLLNIENETMVWAIRGGFFLIEALLVFFVMRMLLAWNDGRPIYLLLASASTVLLFATKETAFITVGTMAIACLSTWLWRKIYTASIGNPGENNLEKAELTWSSFRAALGDKTDLLLIIVAAAAVFIYVGALFFSSFFTYPEGIVGAFKAYAIWTKTGSKDHTQNGMWGYVKWGMKIEAPIFILSAIGTLIALAKARHRFAIFSGFWAFGIFAAYTLIPYKTPWLALSFLLPMCIVAGYGVGEMLRSNDIVLKILGGLMAIMATGILSYQSYDLNFVRYDDEDRVYVYAHTKRGFLDLIKQIEHYGEKSGKGKEVTIEIVSEDYWSMPWYMNNYPHANFHSHFVDANTSEMIVSKKDDQDAEAISRYSSHYKYVGTYPLRPGVDLRLLVRKDLADAGAKDLYEMVDAMKVTPDDSAIEENQTKTP
ncbi:MAG: glycosyltransferase family 39 protein [Pyrinomonadaceae bacterium]